MGQYLRHSDQYQRSDAEGQEGPAQIVAGAEEAAYEEEVEGGEDQQGEGQKHRVSVHQRVADVRPGLGEGSHAHRGEDSAQDEADELDEAGECELGAHEVALFHRQQHRIEHVVGLPGVFEGLEDAQADEEGAHEDGIARQQGHQGGHQKDEGQGRRGKAQLLIQQVFHTGTPFRDRP